MFLLKKKKRIECITILEENALIKTSIWSLDKGYHCRPKLYDVQPTIISALLFLLKTSISTTYFSDRPTCFFGFFGFLLRNLCSLNALSEIDLILHWNNILIYQTPFIVSDNSRSKVNNNVIFVLVMSCSYSFTLWNQRTSVASFTTDKCWLFWSLAVAASSIEPNCLDLNLDRGHSSIPSRGSLSYGLWSF